MINYEATIKLRKNGTYCDMVDMKRSYILSAPNLKEAKAFAWELYKMDTKTITRREMFKVDVSRI